MCPALLRCKPLRARQTDHSGKMLVSAATNKPGNGKKKKPPLGLDTHMLNNRTAAAAGVGKRGLDTKASPELSGIFDNQSGACILT